MCVKCVDRTIVLQSGRSDQINNQCAAWSPFAIHMPSNSWSQTCFVLQLCEERVQSWVITRFGIHAIHLVSGLLILNQSSILLRSGSGLCLGKPVHTNIAVFFKHCWKVIDPPSPLGLNLQVAIYWWTFLKKNIRDGGSTVLYAAFTVELWTLLSLLTLLTLYYSNCFTLLKQ